MPDIVLPKMGLIQSQVGGDSNTWGGNLNTNTALTDAHDHAFGRGGQVPSAGININADLSWGSQWAPTNLHRITFASVTALIDGAQNQSLFVSSADHELYWRTALGNNVKLTAMNSLNVAAFVGGIVGDYTAVGATESFIDSDKAYKFFDGAGKRARGDFGGVKLIGFGTSDTIGVTLASPPGISFSYQATWPLALPASTHTVSIDSSGQMSFSSITRIRHVSPIVGIGSGWSWDSANGYLSSTGAGTWSIGIPSVVGETLTLITFELFGNGVADLTGDILKRAKASSGGSLFGISNTNPPASYADVPCDIADVVVLDGDSFWINLTANAAGLRIGEIRVTYQS